MVNHLPDGQEQVPVSLGRYEVILPIASGGMATVSLAQSRGSGGFERYVAIKLTHPHLSGLEDALMADLLEEAKLAVRIRHPNIVQTLDVGERGASLFLVMDYVEGDSLSGLIKRARKAGIELPLGMQMRVLCDALAGLHAAHELKDEDGVSLDLVHRDVSPQNILVGTDGMARLADFGIARTSSRAQQTQPGAVKGKVAYMPPEQVQGGELDRRCDVWAAGVIAWELVAKRRLFEQTDQLVVAVQLLNDPIPLVRSVNPGAPAALELAISQALQKDRSARTSSAAAFRTALLDACKSSGITLFDHEEVGALVERLTRASLDARHKKAKEILAERRRQSLPPGMVSTETPVPSSRASVPGVPFAPMSVPGATPSSPGPLAQGDATSIAPTQQTDTSAVRDQLPKRHDRRLMFASVVTCVVVLGGALLVFGAPWASKPAARVSEAHTENAATGEPPRSATTSGSINTPVVTLKSAEPSAMPTESAAPSASVAKPSASATVKRPGGKLPPSVPPLAGNPYGPKR